MVSHDVLSQNHPWSQEFGLPQRALLHRDAVFSSASLLHSLALVGCHEVLRFSFHVRYVFRGEVSGRAGVWAERKSPGVLEGQRVGGWATDRRPLQCILQAVRV